MMRRTLAIGSALAAVALAPAAAEARRPIQAVALSPPSNPVLKALRAPLGPDIRIRPATARRLRDTDRYPVLVVDGDTISPAKLARRRRAIDRWMDGGGSVLAFDVRHRHFSRALDDLTGISARPRKGGRSARVLLFRQTRVRGVPTVVVLSAPRLKVVAARRLTAAGRRRAAARQAERVAEIVRGRLMRPDSATPALARVRRTDGQDALPVEALHKTWVFSNVSPPVVPPRAYWADPEHKGNGIGPPTPGSQTVNWTLNHQFDVYLDNSPDHPDGNYQVVTYNLDAEIAPKMTDEKFQFMDDQFQVGGARYNLERAWWTGIVELTVAPDAATDGKLTWLGNAPATPNEEHEYSSGQSFEVGFSASEKGPGVSASYTVSNEESHDVPDWGVTSTTAGNHLAWEFSARNRCDVRPDTYSNSGCFSTACCTDGTPFEPNGLSLGNLPLAASGRWRTKSLLEPGNGKLNFTIATPITLADTYCNWWGVGTCDHQQGFHHQTWETGPEPTAFALDASDVVPVGIKSLTLAPNPADGASNEKVTGTVTLERPAPLAITVKLFSDDANGTLPLPVGNGVSQGSLVIPEGKSSGTFTVNTNDNDLDKGETETVDVTAFYAEPTTARLHVKG